MYENQTYQNILQRMLDAVPNDVDKREGSIIYDALAPVAAELAQMYIELDINLNLMFGDTSSGDYLSQRTTDFGVTRQIATKARRKGLFYASNDAPFDVPISSRYSISGVTYIVLEKTAIGVFILECQTAGIIGNQNFGSLLPIEYVDGLVRAEIEDIIVPGEDIESDDDLRERYLIHVRSPSTSGNKADYINWALEVPGVGAVQVYPIWNGAGTVKVVILDSDKLPASIELVDDVQTYIAPSGDDGEGKAPIGADVTVEAATAVEIDATATIILTGTRTLEQIQDAFEASLVAYLNSIAFAADPSAKYVRIGSLLLDTTGVQDYSDLIINLGTGNVTVNAEEVAIVGMVTLSE